MIQDVTKITQPPGVFAPANPLFVAAISIRLIIFVIGFKVISGGIVEMIAAWQLRQEIDKDWMLALNGFFSLLFGLILSARPITAVEVLVLIVSFYLLVSGVLQIVLAFKVRGWSGKLEAPLNIGGSILGRSIDGSQDTVDGG